MSYLINKGFDKVMNQIYNNLLVYGTGVCSAETFKELRKRLNTTQKSIEQYEILADRVGVVIANALEIHERICDIFKSLNKD